MNWVFLTTVKYKTQEKQGSRWNYNFTIQKLSNQYWRNWKIKERVKICTKHDLPNILDKVTTYIASISFNLFVPQIGWLQYQSITRYVLNKLQFWGSLWLRTNWSILGIQTTCPCGEKVNVQSPLSCRKVALSSLDTRK